MKEIVFMNKDIDSHSIIQPKPTRTQYIVASFRGKLSNTVFWSSFNVKRTYSACILFNEYITMVQLTRFKVIPITFKTQTCVIMRFDDW